MPAMRLLLLASALFAALTAQAQVKVDDPWVRATVAPQKATGAFMQLTSAKPAKVVAASSPVAAVVESVSRARPRCSRRIAKYWMWTVRGMFLPEVTEETERGI